MSVGSGGAPASATLRVPGGTWLSSKGNPNSMVALADWIGHDRQMLFPREDLSCDRGSTTRQRIPVIVSLLLIGLSSNFALSAEKPAADKEPVEVIGRASGYWFTRNWSSYYWREDFTFLLEDEKTGKTWRIISREPTPAYHFRMGTTFPGLPVDWKAKPRVKVVGVKAVDRIPAEFYKFKLDDANLATALVVFVETKPKQWKEFYVNNWFHKWGKEADKKLHRLYAGKSAPYAVYGFVRGQTAPFTKKSQAIIDKNKDNPSLMFHGRILATKSNDFGYEIELIDLIGRDVRTGGHTMLHGDGKSIPLLDGKKPEK